MINPSTIPDVTSDDKLWALLAYVLAPIVPIIILFMEDKKGRPFIKAHNAQALAFSIILYAVVTVTSFIVIGVCIWPLGFLVEIYWGYKAYQGNLVTIPWITDFVKKQGWA
jgi:uncharacterized membrane protein